MESTLDFCIDTKRDDVNCNLFIGSAPIVNTLATFLSIGNKQNINIVLTKDLNMNEACGYLKSTRENNYY